MNVGLHVLRYVAGLAMLAGGFHDLLSPALAGIPLLLGGLALLVANQPAVDRFMLALESLRGRAFQPRRYSR